MGNQYNPMFATHRPVMDMNQVSQQRPMGPMTMGPRYPNQDVMLNNPQPNMNCNQSIVTGSLNVSATGGAPMGGPQPGNALGGAQVGGQPMGPGVPGQTRSAADPEKRKQN